MAKFCGKCGSKLDEQGTCQNCSQHNIKQNTKKQIQKNTVPRWAIVALVSIILLAICVVLLSLFDVFEKDSLNDITLYNFKGDCDEIPVSEQKKVLFSVEASEKVDDNTIILGNIDGTTLGYMNDDGQNGDKYADDGIYSLSVDLKSDKMLVCSYRAVCNEVVSNEYEIVFFTEISESEYLEFQNIYSIVSSAESSEEAEDSLKSSNLIEEYTLDENKVCFRTTFGMTGIFEWNENLDIKGTGQNATYCPSKSDYWSAYQNLQKINKVPNQDIANGNIAVLRPFRTAQFKYDDFLYAGTLLSNFTLGRVDCIDDSNVTVNTMKSLDEYSVVLLDSHGTLSNFTNSAWDVVNNDPYLLTGEEYSAFGMWTSADWQASRIVVCGTNIFYGKGFVAVGAKFFEKYYEDNELEHSVFFLGTCYSMKNDSIADILIKKGAEVVFGNSDIVCTGYCNNTLFETIINGMLLSGMSANEAFQEAQKLYGETDPCNTKCQYKMKGNGDYTIVFSETVTTSDERDIVLVLDNSGSMFGTPIQETKKASKKFIETVLKEDASIGVVKYDSEAYMLSNFSMNEEYLNNTIDAMYAGGNTNILSGLTLADEMLEQSNAKKKIIVLMSDGLPTDNTNEELIEYAKGLQKKGITVYTLGFFGSLYYEKAEAQALMGGMASEGCHYEVADADSLVYFFGDVADQISGQKYIYIRIACPVDVTVKYKGEKLCSEDGKLNTRTSFGSLTFEENTDNNDSSDDKDDLVKILRLKEGTEYDIRIEGTGRGKMDYTIGFMDEDGEYSDMRKFRNVPITRKTVIDTVAANESTTVLKVDEDGDGKYDLTYKAKENSRGKIVKYDYVWYIVGGASLLVVAVAVTTVVIKKKKIRIKKGH